MSEEDKQKILQALFEEVRRIVNEIAKIVMPIIKRMLNDKKACKCLHISKNTKNKRIKNKQIKRLEGMLINYMAL